MNKNRFSLDNLPGSLLMWLILINELVIFGGLIIAAKIFKHREPTLFTSSLDLIDQKSLIFSTVVLLIGGFFAAEFIHALKNQQRRYGLFNLMGATACGMFFLIHKYHDLGKLSQSGLNFAKDDFWLYYWTIMGFHFVHVIVAVGILVFLLWSFIRAHFQRKTDLEIKDYESGVLFWHLCDLIWIMIFPLFYWRF